MIRLLILLSSLFLFPSVSFALETTVTVGDSGSSCHPCDYTTLAAAQTAEVRDLVAATEVITFECYEMEEVLAATINWGGWTADDSYHPIVRGASGDRTGANTSAWSTDRYRIKISNTVLFQIPGSVGFEVYDLQVHLYGSLPSTYTYGFSFSSGGAYHGTIERTYIWWETANATTRLRGVNVATTASITYLNNIMRMTGTATGFTEFGLNIALGGGVILVHNNLFDGIYYPVTIAGTSFSTGYNNIIIDAPGGYSGIDTGANNVCDGTYPGCDENNATLAFTDQANGVYTLTSGSTSLIATGHDVSSDLTLDFASALRSLPYDIGPFKYATSGGGGSGSGGWGNAPWSDSGRLEWGETGKWQ